MIAISRFRYKAWNDNYVWISFNELVVVVEFSMFHNLTCEYRAVYSNSKDSKSFYEHFWFGFWIEFEWKLVIEMILTWHFSWMAWDKWEINTIKSNRMDQYTKSIKNTISFERQNWKFETINVQVSQSNTIVWCVYNFFSLNFYNEIYSLDQYRINNIIILYFSVLFVGICSIISIGVMKQD